MARRKRPLRNPDVPEEYQDMWLCEFCSRLFEGLDPPEACGCGNRFFDNVCDLMRASTSAVKH